MSREVVKVFCQRNKRNNHRIGTVIADREGYAVEYVAEVWYSGSVFGSERMVTDRLRNDEVVEFAAFCRPCKRPVVLDSRSLLDAAQNGIRGYHAPFSDAIDNVWKQAGREPLYPSDIRRLKNDPRGSG